MTDREKTLLSGCLKREKPAWDALVLEYSPLVYHAIKRTFLFYHAEPSSDVVEDLYQDFFLSLLRDNCKKLRQFRGDRGCSLASWLRVIATRMTIDFLRKQQGRVPAATEVLPLSQNDPPDFIISAEEERLFSEALANLPPRDRLLMRLYYGQGLGPQEIARLLRVSVNVVYTQKSRILDKLREMLGKARSP